MPIALGATALALFAFIVLYERHTLTSGEISDREGRLIERFARDRVTEIRVTRGGQRAVLVRQTKKPSNDESHDPPNVESPNVESPNVESPSESMSAADNEWTLAEPVRAAADDEAVRAALSALEWAQAKRTIEGVGDAERKRFGLDKPAARVRLRIANEWVDVRFGAKDPTGMGVYVSLGHEARAFVTGSEAFEPFARDVTQFRTKTLFTAELDCDAITTPEGTAELRDGRWWLKEPAMLASTARVEQLIDSLRDLKAERYVRGGSSLGFETSGLEVSARCPRQIRLRVGSVCGTHAEERYAQVDSGPVVCVLSSDLDALNPQARDLQDLRLMDAKPDEIRSVDIKLGGSSWAWKPGDHKGHKESDDRGGSGADPERVREWLGKLRAQRATRVEPANATTLATWGLANPRGRLRVGRERGGKNANLVVHVGAATPDGIAIRRAEEPAVLVFPPEVAEELSVSALRFRSHTLWDKEIVALTRIAIAGVSATDEFERHDGVWRAVPSNGSDTSSNASRARELADRLATLQTERFVAERATAAHGLAKPSAVVTLQFQPADHAHHDHDGAHEAAAKKDEPDAPRERVLELGAEAEHGRFARLRGDPAVFVIAASVADVILR